MRKLVKRIEAAGLTVVLSKNGHWKVFQGGMLVGTLAGSASDHRSIRNSLADIRRATGISLKETR
jgi:hypothetical protein